MTDQPITAWLTSSELEELTGRKLWKAQARKLAAMGIMFRLNGVGRPLVERALVLSGASLPQPVKPKRELNWAALETPGPRRQSVRKPK